MILNLIQSLLYLFSTFIVVNGYAVCAYFSNFYLLFLFIPLYIFINIYPSIIKRSTLKLKILSDGCSLLNYMLITSAVTASITLFRLFAHIEPSYKNIIINSIVAIILEILIFWNGIIRVYSTSVQLGIYKRIVGAILGWIPLVNIYFLIRIIIICMREVQIEEKRNKLNKSRVDEQLCKTKYPIVFVHGVFFRDSKYMNYWGRIPSDLEVNGAKIFYGNHQSALSVEDSANEIARRIREVLTLTGAEKVNVIAHSKGGLDTRYAISQLGMDECIASLTTINTPHRGCIFADYLFSKASDEFVKSVADKYNSGMKMLGDVSPDFTAAVKDLTASACVEFNKKINDSPFVYYQSVMSKQNRASSGKFPLNISYPLVKKFDGINDGLVSIESAKWGDKFTILTVKGSRGISHADVIDLTKENIKGFNVREFYVSLVNDLKNKGF